MMHIWNNQFQIQAMVYLSSQYHINIMTYKLEVPAIFELNHSSNHN